MRVCVCACVCVCVCVCVLSFDNVISDLHECRFMTGWHAKVTRYFGMFCEIIFTESPARVIY